MRSATRGSDTSAAEVTNVSRHGFWILIQGREMFAEFEKFPWLREAPVGQLLRVELLHPDHLYWPDLDVDLTVGSIEHPERFPLVSAVSPKRSLGRVRVARKVSRPGGPRPKRG